MSLEQQLSDAIAAQNALTQAVATKKGEIDAATAAQQAAFEAWRSNARFDMPFLNLLRNAHFQKKDAGGAFIDLPLSIGSDVTSWSIISPGAAGIPQAVSDYLAGGLVVGHGNVLKCTFGAPPLATPRYWLASNSVFGHWSAGWKFIYVESGNFNGVAAGQTTSRIESGMRAWHIDATFGTVTPGTVAYFASPFVVPGIVTNVEQVKTINYQSTSMLLTNA